MEKLCCKLGWSADACMTKQLHTSRHELCNAARLTPGRLLKTCWSTTARMEWPRKSKLCRPDWGAIVASSSPLHCSLTCASSASNTYRIAHNLDLAAVTLSLDLGAWLSWTCDIYMFV